jgi:hypothetical protein
MTFAVWTKLCVLHRMRHVCVNVWPLETVESPKE